MIGCCRDDDDDNNGEGLVCVGTGLTDESEKGRRPKFGDCVLPASPGTEGVGTKWIPPVSSSAGEAVAAPADDGDTVARTRQA